MSVVWLVQNTLGRYSNDIVYRQDKEQVKKILFEVYGYKDIYEFIPPEVDTENMDKFLRTVFTYHERPAEELEQLKK